MLDWRRQNPRFQGENLDRNLPLADSLRALAAEHAMTPAQLALAWLLGRGPDIVPIPGTRHATRLLENAAAAAMLLDLPLLRRLQRTMVEHPVAGDRYTAQGMASIDG
jgi:aryl-alcohol dehydrogenase-like predicted oxidoreductase